MLKLGDNKEVVKDLSDLMKYMPENGLVELVVMDPPYGQNKAAWDTTEKAEQWLGKVFLKPSFNIP